MELDDALSPWDAALPDVRAAILLRAAAALAADFDADLTREIAYHESVDALVAAARDEERMLDFAPTDPELAVMLAALWARMETEDGGFPAHVRANMEIVKTDVRGKFKARSSLSVKKKVRLTSGVVGVNLGALRRFCGAAFPSIDNLHDVTGDEIFARCAELRDEAASATAAPHSKSLVDTWMWDEGEKGPAKYFISFEAAAPFSRTLRALSKLPFTGSQDYFYIDFLGIPRYESLIDDRLGHAWAARMASFEKLVLNLHWSYDKVWALGRRFVIAEVLFVLLANGPEAVIFTCSVSPDMHVGRTSKGMSSHEPTFLDLLADDLDTVLEHIYSINYNESSSFGGDKPSFVLPLLCQALHNSFHRDASDLADEERLNYLVQAAVCDWIFIRAEEGLSNLRADEWSTHRLPLAFARFLLQAPQKWRALNSHTSARAHELAERVWKARKKCGRSDESWRDAIAAANVMRKLSPSVGALTRVRQYSEEGSSNIYGGPGFLSPINSSESASTSRFEGKGYDIDATVRSGSAIQDAQKTHEAQLRELRDLEKKYRDLLVSDLRAGNVVLFLGAGIFRNAQMPDWKTLLLQLIYKYKETAGRDPKNVYSEVHDTAERLRAYTEDSTKFEMVAQELESLLNSKKDDTFKKEVLRILKYNASKHERKMKTKLALLRLLPFRSILTTNFTRAFSGVDYSLVRGDISDNRSLDLRKFLNNTREISFPASLVSHASRDVQLLACAYDNNDDSLKPLPALDANIDVPVLHIHGTSTPVCTRESYRSLLYKSPAYLPFLRSFLATSKILFYGYSLSDSYFNEVRSEILAMLKETSSDGGVPMSTRDGVKKGGDHIVLGYHLDWWDLSKSTLSSLADIRYKHEHEGICTIPVRESKPNVDAFISPLRELMELTSPQCLFARKFFGKRILALELPYKEPLPRSGFEESALTLSSLVYAADGLPSERETERQSRERDRSVWRSEFRDACVRFTRTRSDYNMLLNALRGVGGLVERARQCLPLPFDSGGSAAAATPSPLRSGSKSKVGGCIWVSFSVEDFKKAVSEGGCWDALLIADCDPFKDVLQELRKDPSCCFPALEYRQDKSANKGVAPAAHEGSHAERHVRRTLARGRGYVDYCENRDASVFTALLKLFDEKL